MKKAGSCRPLSISYSLQKQPIPNSKAGFQKIFVIYLKRLFTKNWPA
jgi:hypothetical protein